MKSLDKHAVLSFTVGFLMSAFQLCLYLCNAMKTVKCSKKNPPTQVKCYANKYRWILLLYIVRVMSI